MTQKPFNLGTDVRISPPDWPDMEADAVRPGDLSTFAPHGNGLYGLQDNRRNANPFHSAPPQEAAAGIIFFENGIARADLSALLRILSIRSERKEYAAYLHEAEDPGDEGYLVQLRIVSNFALKHLFMPKEDTKDPPPQALTTDELLWRFFEHERERWGTSFDEDSRGLCGLFGGDGDLAREELSFGFMVENGYFGVYRVWSRAWLVTK